MFRLICCICLFLLTFGFSQSSLQSEQSLQVGVSLPLTGDLAEYGVAARNGIELAQELHPQYVNALRFVYEDNRYDAKQAITSFTKLREINQVTLIYLWGETPLHAVAPLAERHHMPLVAMSLDPAPAHHKKYVMRSINDSEQFIAQLLKYLRKKNYKKIVILKTEDAYLNSLVAGFERLKHPDEEIEVLFSFLPGNNDFKTAISKLKLSDYDALGVYLFPGQVSNFYRQAGRLGLHLPSFGTDIFESRNEVQGSEGHMIGAVYPNIRVPADFESRYVEKYGNDIQLAFAYNAYEFARTAGFALQGKRGISAEQVLELMRLAPSQMGAEFAFTEAKNGDQYYRFPVVVKEIKKNSFQIVG